MPRLSRTTRANRVLGCAEGGERVPEAKECPMCGEFMRHETRVTVSRVPGTAQEVKTPVREWVCPECDYFEEDESKVVVES